MFSENTDLNSVDLQAQDPIIIQPARPVQPIQTTQPSQTTQPAEVETNVEISTPVVMASHSSKGYYARRGLFGRRVYIRRGWRGQRSGYFMQRGPVRRIISAPFRAVRSAQGGC